MKVKTMQKEIIYRHHLLCKKPLAESTDIEASMEMIYTYRNIIWAAKNFYSAKKVFDGLTELNHKYNMAIKHYDSSDALNKISAYEQLKYYEELYINLEDPKDILISKLKNRIDMINFIISIYSEPKDKHYKILKLEY